MVVGAMSSYSADVVIVGGGLVGAATAYFLAGEGVDCVVVERDGIASHASGFSYAALGTFDEAGMDGAHFDVASLGMRLHHELAESLLDETGVNVEFRERPSLSLAFDEDEVVAAQSPEGAERDRRSWEVDVQGYTVQWLTTEEALQVEPRINPAVLGAVYTEGTCDVNAQRLTLALAMGAEQRGARVMRGTVTGLSREGDRVRGVTLDEGEIACDRVVVATGPWSEAATEWLGVPIRMQPWKGQILRLRLPGPPIRTSVGGGDHFASTKPDGLTWVGPTFEDAGIDETTTDWARDEIMAGVSRNVPSLAEGEVVVHTACVRPLSADRKLVLGEVPGLEGAYTATGGGRLGLMLGPAMARLTADLIAKGTTTVPLDEFDPGRFAEGQRT
jgi:glycine/D-amino acid oxidase-like deaminating enzyme